MKAFILITLFALTAFFASATPSCSNDYGQPEDSDCVKVATDGGINGIVDLEDVLRIASPGWGLTTSEAMEAYEDGAILVAFNGDVSRVYLTYSAVTQDFAVCQ